MSFHPCQLEFKALSVSNLTASSKINTCFKQNETMTLCKKKNSRKKPVNSRMHWYYRNERFPFMLLVSIVAHVKATLQTNMKK